MSTELVPDYFPIGVTRKYGGKDRGTVLQITLPAIDYVDLTKREALILRSALNEFIGDSQTSELESLRAENSKLREALKTVRETLPWGDAENAIMRAASIINAALAYTPTKESDPK